MAVTAPSSACNRAMPKLQCPIPGYDPDSAFAYVRKHGLAVRAVGVYIGLPGQ